MQHKTSPTNIAVRTSLQVVVLIVASCSVIAMYMLHEYHLVLLDLSG